MSLWLTVGWLLSKMRNLVTQQPKGKNVLGKQRGFTKSLRLQTQQLIRRTNLTAPRDASPSLHLSPQHSSPSFPSSTFLSVLSVISRCLPPSPHPKPTRRSIWSLCSPKTRLLNPIDLPPVTNAWINRAHHHPPINISGWPLCVAVPRPGST